MWIMISHGTLLYQGQTYSLTGSTERFVSCPPSPFPPLKGIKESNETSNTSWNVKPPMSDQDRISPYRINTISLDEK